MWLQLQCASQRDEIWRKGIDSHGDYNPTCTNSTSNITADPKMPNQYATDHMACEEPFERFLTKSTWPNQHELVRGKLYLQWRRCASPQGAIEMRMVYNCTIGWMTIGAENAGGGHNGMNGASTVMAVNDPARTTNRYSIKIARLRLMRRFR